MYGMVLSTPCCYATIMAIWYLANTVELVDRLTDSKRLISVSNSLVDSKKRTPHLGNRSDICHILLGSSLPLALQYRAALLSLMVDVAVMLGAPEKAAQAQMEQALAFESKLAHVNTPHQINTASIGRRWERLQGPPRLESDSFNVQLVNCVCRFWFRMKTAPARTCTIDTPSLACTATYQR